MCPKVRFGRNTTDPDQMVVVPCICAGRIPVAMVVEAGSHFTHEFRSH